MSKINYRYYYLLAKAYLAQFSTNSSPFEEVYYFIHIPKTCGTSFRFMLYKQFPQKEIYPNVKDLKDSNGKYPKLKSIVSNKAAIQKRIRLFMGHFPFKAGEKVFDKKVNCITFLRDPIKRTISNLQHLQRLDPKHKGASLSEILDKVEVFQTNMQTRFLSDLSNERPPHPDRLKEAKQNLEKIKFIGIAERFKDSIKLIESTFNWNLGIHLQLNEKKMTQNNELNDDLLEKIKVINQLDIELYEYACMLFEKRYSLNK